SRGQRLLRKVREAFDGALNESTLRDIFDVEECSFVSIACHNRNGALGYIDIHLNVGFRLGKLRAVRITLELRASAFKRCAPEERSRWQIHENLFENGCRPCKPNHEHLPPLKADVTGGSIRHIDYSPPGAHLSQKYARRSATDHLFTSVDGKVSILVERAITVLSDIHPPALNILHTMNVPIGGDLMPEVPDAVLLHHNAKRGISAGKIIRKAFMRNKMTIERAAPRHHVKKAVDIK